MYILSKTKKAFWYCNKVTREFKVTKLFMKIGLIGAGNMGEAMIGALLKARIFQSSSIYIADIIKDRLNYLIETYGVGALEDNFQLFNQCDIVILAVKPQQLNEVLQQISRRHEYRVSDRKLIISIAAGFPLRKIEKSLYQTLNKQACQKLPIIRVMPNTPALVLAGMSGMSANRNATEEDVKTTRTILEAMGKVIEFKEESLDAVTALSASGPAYIFYLVESMIQAGINVGLEPDDAVLLSITTLKGAAKLLEESKESPKSLRHKVTSPGGTTEAALKVLEQYDFKQGIIEAIAAATRRSKELRR
jgi:pyrroline-5-carboxylate reductase